MQTTHRAMTSRQKAELHGYVAWSTWLVGAALFACVGFLLAGFLRFLTEYVYPSAHFLWWATPAVLLLLLLYRRAKRWTGGRDFRQHVAADLKQGFVSVHHVDIVDAIEVEELEDEGPSYFLRTVEGQVIVFAGQYLERYKLRRFPWKSFEITEAPASKVFFGIKRLGVPLAPSFIREPFTWEEFKQYGSGKFKIIDADFESLKIKKSRSRGVSPDQRSSPPT